MAAVVGLFVVAITTSVAVLLGPARAPQPQVLRGVQIGINISAAAVEPAVPPGLFYSSTRPLSLYPSGQPEADDVNQGLMDDCVHAAILASLADTEFGRRLIQRSIFVQHDKRQAPSFKVSYTVPAPAYNVSANASVSGYLLGRHWPADSSTVSTRSVSTAARDGQGNWATILQKAAVKINDAYHNQNSLTGYAAMTNLDPEKTFRTFVGAQHTSTLLHTPFAIDDIGRSLAENAILMLGTSQRSSVQNLSRGAQIEPHHAYSILASNATAGLITIRNPWGYNAGDQALEKGYSRHGRIDILEKDLQAFDLFFKGEFAASNHPHSA